MLPDEELDLMRTTVVDASAQRLRDELERREKRALAMWRAFCKEEWPRKKLWIASETFTAIAVCLIYMSFLLLNKTTMTYEILVELIVSFFILVSVAMLLPVFLVNRKRVTIWKKFQEQFPEDAEVLMYPPR